MGRLKAVRRSNRGLTGRDAMLSGLCSLTSDMIVKKGRSMRRCANKALRCITHRFRDEKSWLGLVDISLVS